MIFPRGGMTRHKRQTLRRRGRQQHRERWLISYADLVTLLFAFFVVLYAVSRYTAEHAHHSASALQAALSDHGSPVNPVAPPHGSGDEELSKLSQGVEQMIHDEQLRGRVSIRTDRRGLVISLAEAGFYDAGSDRIHDSAEAVIAGLARHLRPLPNQIRIEGHTDSTPIHSARFPSNWHLSTARATGIVSVLIERYGLSPSRLAAAGYGEHHPLADNATAEGRLRNRRVDLVVLNTSVAQAEGP